MKRFIATSTWLLTIALTTAAAHADTVIRFGDLGVDTANLYQYLGVQEGIYQKHGIDLKLVSFLTGGPSVMPAAESHQIDLGGIGTPILTAISRGIGIKVVGAPPAKRQEFVLVARPDIKSLNDLKGQTVGISSVGGGHDQALRVILKAEGINRADIKTISTGNASNGYLAFKSGQLAADFVSEPVLSKIQLEGSGHILAKAVDYYGRYEHSYIFATDQFIKDHPDEIRSYFEANREAILYAETHRDELIAFGEKKLNLDGQLLKKIFDDAIPQWDDSQQVDVEGMLNAVKILQDVGDIEKNYQPDINQIVDLRFVNGREASGK